MRKMLLNKVPSLVVLLVGFFCVTQTVATHAQAVYSASLYFKLSTIPNGLAGTYTATIPGGISFTTGSGFASIDAASSVADDTQQYVEAVYGTSGGAGPTSGSAFSVVSSSFPFSNVVFTNTDSTPHGVALSLEYELATLEHSFHSMCGAFANSTLEVFDENFTLLHSGVLSSSIVGVGFANQFFANSITINLSIPANSSKTVYVAGFVMGSAYCENVVPEPGTVACFVGIGTVGSAFLWCRRKYLGKSNG
jgi:hypothetical protein